MNKYVDKLTGGDLRSIGRSDEIARLVNNQEEFDELFKGLYEADRKIIMRTADSIEKITITTPGVLKKYKKQLLSFLKSAKEIEFKWHLALLIPRLKLNKDELGLSWQHLTEWALDKKESRIVRVNSVQGLYNLLTQYLDLWEDLNLTMTEIEKEKIPSINARIRKLRLNQPKCSR